MEREALSDLEPMDLKPNHNSPVLTDSVPINKSRLGLSSKLVPHSASATGYSSSGLYLSSPRRKIVPSKLDDVRASGWLDAMQSSSPPRKKLNKEYSVESVDSECDEADSAYCTWLVRTYLLSINS